MTSIKNELLVQRAHGNISFREMKQENEKIKMMATKMRRQRMDYGFITSILHIHFEREQKKGIATRRRKKN